MDWWHWVLVGFFAGVGLAFGQAVGHGLLSLIAKK